jgi:lipopolysaccharide export system ATP-binding protein
MEQEIHQDPEQTEALKVVPLVKGTDESKPTEDKPDNNKLDDKPADDKPDVNKMSMEEVERELATRLKHKELHSEGLVKRYGKRTVANHVTFNVKQGEIVGLLGPNGAGKTTSFYMTTGLIVPNEGHVFIDDKEITSYPVYKRARAGIGYLPQEASVFRKLSVEDNIMAVLEMTKLSHQEQLDKLESLINEFRLNKVRKNKGDRLSGGERRRTEIARCLAIDPKFIMLDEPFAGVDPIAVEDIQHIVWRLKYRNIGILITDHNVQETLSITDRAYLLFEGRILFQGVPEELSANKTVRKNYLSDNFVYRKFQSNEEDRAFAAEARRELLRELL